MSRLFLIRLAVMAALGVVTFAGLWTYAVLSKTTPEEKLAALEKEVKPKGGSIFKTVLGGKQVVFLLMDCSVYVLEITPDEIKQDRVLKPGFYFGLDVCTDQSIAMENGYVSVYLANRAIGAGGGNTSGGYYRSEDGRSWEKKTTEGWTKEGETK